MSWCWIVLCWNWICWIFGCGCIVVWGRSDWVWGNIVLLLMYVCFSVFYCVFDCWYVWCLCWNMVWLIVWVLCDCWLVNEMSLVWWSCYGGDLVDVFCLDMWGRLIGSCLGCCWSWFCRCVNVCCFFWLCVCCYILYRCWLFFLMVWSWLESLMYCFWYVCCLG